MSFGFSTALTKTNTAAAASLMLDMLNGQALDPRITFTNASTASIPTFFGSDGRLATMGLNIQTYSNDFTNSAWFKTACSVTPNQAGITGITTTSTLVTEDSTTDTHTVVYNPTSVSIGVTITGSVYLKAANRSWVHVYFNSGVVNGGAWFNLSTGVLGTRQPNNTAATITPVGGGWYRCSISGVTTLASVGLGVLSATGDGNVTYAGTGLATYYMAASQIEVSAVANTYSATTSAAGIGPRSDYDPSTPLDSGARGPELVTNGDFSYGGNLIANSTAFSGTWTIGNDANPPSAVTSNAGQAPDNTNTASLLTPGISGNAPSVASPAANRMYQQPPAVTANGTYTFSIWVKTYVQQTTVGIYINDASTDVVRGSTVVLSSTQWTRISCTATTIGATPGLRAVVATTYPVLVWGAQVEFGSVMSNYTATTGSSVATPNWTVAAGVTFANGVANFATTGSIANTLYQTCLPAINNKIYAVTMDVSVSAGTYEVHVGGYPGNTMSSVSGRSTWYVTNGALSNGNIIVGTGSSFAGTIDNISVKEVIPATTGGELAVNGNFANGTTGWTGTINGSSVAAANGILTLTSVGFGGFQLNVNPAFTLGKTYVIAYTVTSTNLSGGITINNGNGVGATGTGGISPGVNYLTFQVTTSGMYLVVTSGSAGTISFSNISIYEVVFTPKGQLIEEARTNLLLNSRDVTNASWAKVDVTPVRNQVGLDGVANTACLLTEGSAGTAYWGPSVGGVTAGSTVTISYVFKRGNTDWIAVLVGETTVTDYCRAWFNLGTGAKGNVTTGGVATNASSTMTSLGGGWYRCTVTCTPNGTYTAVGANCLSANANGSTTRVSGATYIVDCAGLEVGGFATSIIVTGASTVTRAADVESMTGGNLTSWFNSVQGTFVVETMTNVPAAYTTNQYVIAASDGTLNNRVAIFRSTVVGDYSYRVTSGGIAILAAAVSSVGTGNTVVKEAITYGSNGANGATNGTALTAGATTVPTGINAFHIGNNELGTQTQCFNGWIRKIRFYPVSSNSTQLINYTT